MAPEMSVSVKRPARIQGSNDAPSDKSKSHRAAIFNALASGSSEKQNYSARITATQTNPAPQNYTKTLKITGFGATGIREPENVLNAGNSGTTMRLLMGMLAANEINSVLTGDHSLRSRPMIREIRALRQMGAQIWSRGDRSLPPISVK